MHEVGTSFELTGNYVKAKEEEEEAEEINFLND